MASNPEHTNSGQPVIPFPYQIQIEHLLNPLWAMQEIRTAPITIPPKTDKTRTPEKIFNYPSSVKDINRDTILPLPRGWLYLDMNIALENVTEPNVNAAIVDSDQPYPMLKSSYTPPEILLRIFQTPTDPEYNKFTQLVFPKAEMRDLQQLAALHEIKYSYALFVVMEDKHGDRAKRHLKYIRQNYRLLDVHAQQHILQILAPPPSDKIVTHFSATAKYNGDDQGTDWNFLQSSQGRSYITSMIDFWKHAAAASYKTMKFLSNEKITNDTTMADEASSQGTDGEDTPIINMMQQGGAALKNNNNLADKMTTESGKDNSADQGKRNKNKTKEKQKDKQTVYVPKTPQQHQPSYIIRTQSEEYEQQRRRQLQIEEVVDRLFDANQFDETKYTAVCNQWHKEKQYTIQQVEEDLKYDKFKQANINKKKREEEEKQRHVHFGGTRFGRNSNTQYIHKPPNPSYIPNRHSYTDYNKSNQGAPGPQPPPNGNPPGTSPYGNANNINNQNANTGYGGGYNNNNYNNNYNSNGTNTNGGGHSNSNMRFHDDPACRRFNNYNHNTNVGNAGSNNGNSNNNNTAGSGRQQEEKQTPEQLMQQLKQAQQELDKLRKEKLNANYNWHLSNKATGTTAQQRQQQLNQQFVNIARRHRPANKQGAQTFNNPSNEKDLAGSIAQMLNGNQLPPRNHQGTLPSDPIGAIPTPIPPATAMDHRYPTMMENRNDIFNFTVDNVNQIDNYVRDFDYHINATVSQRATPTEQSIALNTSLVYYIYP